MGAGRKKSGSGIISIDLYRAPGVDIIGDIQKLPLMSNSIDGVIARGVLEHVPAPPNVAKEIFRILKPGGKVFSSIPFMQGYHPSPGDYQRYTIDGIQILFSDFRKIDCGITRGSASSFIWITREFLSEVFSFNNKTVYRALKIVFGWLLQPLKLLDPVTERHSACHIAASGFTFLGEKAEEHD